MSRASPQLKASDRIEYGNIDDHGIRKLANRVAAYRRVAAFLERTLRP